MLYKTKCHEDIEYEDIYMFLFSGSHIDLDQHLDNFVSDIGLKSDDGFLINDEILWTTNKEIAAKAVLMDCLALENDEIIKSIAGHINHFFCNQGIPIPSEYSEHEIFLKLKNVIICELRAIRSGNGE